MFANEYKAIVSIARQLASDIRLRDFRINDIWIPWTTVDQQREHLNHMKDFYSSREQVCPIGDASSLLADAALSADEDSVSLELEEPRLSSSFARLDI